MVSDGTPNGRELARWQGRVDTNIESLKGQASSLRREVSQLRSLSVTDERVRALRESVDELRQELGKLTVEVNANAQFRMKMIGAAGIVSVIASVGVTILLHYLGAS